MLNQQTLLCLPVLALCCQYWLVKPVLTSLLAGMAHRAEIAPAAYANARHVHWILQLTVVHYSHSLLCTMAVRPRTRTQGPFEKGLTGLVR